MYTTRNSLNNPKNHTGQSLVEVVVAVMVLLLFMTIPLIDMVTFSLRYNFLLMASRDSAYYACRSKTFQTNISPTDLSVVNTASSVAQSSAAPFPVTINSVNSAIVITKISDGTVSRQTTPLALPADTTNYTYQIETTINGSTNPILTVSNGNNGFLNVPGLTSPISVTICSREFSENPQGLNQ